MILSRLRRMPFQHVTAIAFLLITAILLSNALGGLVRGAKVSAFMPVAIAGALVGWVLGNRRLNGWLAWGGMIVFGVIFLWVSTAQLGAPFLRLVQALPDVAYQGFFWFWDPQSNPVDLSIAGSAWSNIVTQSAGLWGRVAQWIPNIQNASNRYDPVVYVLMWSLALWLVIAWEGWFVSRGSVLTASMPSMILLGEVLYLTNPDISSLWVLLWITLLLMGLTHFRVTFISWLKRHVDYAEIILDTTISIVFVISMTLSVLAWFIPSVPIQQIVDEIRSHSVDAKPGTKSLADSLGLKSPAKGNRRAGYGNTTVIRHVIGGGPELSRELVMTISTGELPPGQSFSPSLIPPYHRWRSYTLDRYIGTGWANTPVEDVRYESDAQVFASIPERYRVLRQNVRMEDTSNGNVYWDGILQSVNQPFEVSWRVKPETNPPVNANLLGKGDILGAFSPEEFYQVTSLIPIVDAKKLRATSSRYSDEIRTHYLLLPEGVPDRVLALAREITATAPTPYDEARAIETYLRKNYPYTLNIPAPPANRDVVDYFLFDLKKGFCDYYATAMVVMARAVGLPSRMVFGYAGGAYDFNAAEYKVVRADAHAWVEVYFPEVGWVEFDPTSGRPSIDRQAEETSPAEPYFQPGNLGNLVTLRGTSAVEFGLWGLVIVIALAILVILLQLGEFWLLTHLSPIRAMRMIYRGLFFVGRKVAGSNMRGETTDEFATSLRSRLAYLSDKEWLDKLLSPAIPELNKLTDLYLRAIYTQRPPSKDEVHSALHTWQALRWRLLLANLLVFIPPAKVVSMES